MNMWTRAASRAIRFYFNRSPVERGKYWLLHRSSRFLIAPVGDGLWVRATGVSGFEWKALRGQPGEATTVSMFRKLLKPGMTVIDVGANVGYYGLVAARAVGPEGQVHVFEATPAVAERLRENVRINRLGNVVVNHAAVCDRTGEVEFRLQDDDSEGNSLVSYSNDWLSVRVSAVSLDDYVAKHGIRQVDVVKIDVEGAELLVLAGATELLSRAVPPVLIVESNPATLRDAGSSAEELVGRLAAFGYKSYPVEQLTQGPSAVWNILALHETHVVTGIPVLLGLRAST